MSAHRRPSGHHARAVSTIVLALLLDAGAGLWYAAVQHLPATSGIAYALGVATTSGSSVPAGTSPVARLITSLAQLTVIPLFGAAFSLFTTGLTSGAVRTHVAGAEKRIREHVEDRFRHHLGKPPDSAPPV